MTMSMAPVRQRRPIILLICGMVAAAVPVAQTGRPSATALEMTAYRAIGAKHPDASIRNGDYLAERLLGPQERGILKETGADAVLAALALDTEAAWASLGNRGGLARAVHVRTRYIDAVLEESLKTGARQVVILGAGLDSRAYRFDGEMQNRPRLRTRLSLQTQSYKKNRVLEIVRLAPDHVTFAPIDFTKQSLLDVLTGAGYDRKAKTIFIWEGVTMYIPEAAVDSTLRFVASNAAPGSRIVFDYFLESALRAPTPDLKDTTRRVASVGEPFVFRDARRDDATVVRETAGPRNRSSLTSATGSSVTQLPCRREATCRRVRSIAFARRPSVRRLRPDFHPASREIKQERRPT